MLQTSWGSPALFFALVLALTLYGLTAAQQFPVEKRAKVLRSGAGAAILWGTMLAALFAVLLAVVFAARALPWPQAVISAGCALLVAPLLLQRLADSFVDGRRGLLAFAGLALVLVNVGLRMTA